jgi:hypothetical protein
MTHFRVPESDTIVPSPTREARAGLAVRRFDWHNIMDGLRLLRRRDWKLSPATTGWLGIGLATLVSLITLNTSEEEAKLEALLIGITAGAFLIGLWLLFRDLRGKVERRDIAGELLSYMEKLEKHFPAIEVPQEHDREAVPHQ